MPLVIAAAVALAGTFLVGIVLAVLQASEQEHRDAELRRDPTVSEGPWAPTDEQSPDNCSADDDRVSISFTGLVALLNSPGGKIVESDAACAAAWLRAWGSS